MAAEIICTVCGARQPLVAALEGAAVREAWQAALALSAGVEFAQTVAAYVDWFAQPAKAPQARTVVRVLADLTSRIQAGRVKQKGISRPAPLAVWVDGMRLITGGHTAAERPLTSNGYLAGIVWRRAEAGTAGQGTPDLAPDAGPVPAAERPDPVLARNHLLNEIKGLQVMLAGARDEAAQESLRRQMSVAQSRLAESAGADHGTGV